MTPTEPPKKAIGTNTAESTSAMPTSAPVIWLIDLRVAALGGSPSSLITRSTFSTTTIASSTSRPIASTMPNIVSVLMLKPNAASTPNVPSSTTGTAMVGISVARKFCRNRNITRKTSTIASSERLHDLLDREPHERRRVDRVDRPSSPGGKYCESSSTRARTAAAVSSAFAPAASRTPMPRRRACR